MTVEQAETNEEYEVRYHDAVMWQSRHARKLYARLLHLQKIEEDRERALETAQAERRRVSLELREAQETLLEMAGAPHDGIYHVRVTPVTQSQVIGGVTPVTDQE